MAGTRESYEIAALLPMKVMFQHLPNKTTSIYNMELPVKSPVEQLKKDIAQRVKVPPNFQRWTYRGKILNDRDTILSLRLKRDEIFFVEQTDMLQEQQIR